MRKEYTNKYILRTSLILVILISTFLCVYALQHYNNNSITSNNQFMREGNILDNGRGMPGSGNGQIENNHNNQFNSKGNGNETKLNEGNQGTQPDGNNRQRGSNKNMQPGQFDGNMQRGGVESKYLQPLTIYSVIFLILSYSIYYFFKNQKIKINLKDEKFVLITLLAVGLLLRIWASNLVNAHNDVNLFKNWSQVAANGLSQFYSNARQADYPPLYIYVLALIGKLASISTLNSYYILLLKIPSITSDIITGYFIYKLGKKYFSSAISILLAAFYIFNPAVFIDSTFWGQVDSFFTLLIVIAIYLLNCKKYVYSSIMFMLSVLMKPQGIIFLPILFFELVRKKKLKNFIYCAIAAVVTTIIIIIPFSLNQQSPLWLFNLYSKTISEYPYASVNAFNFFSLIGGNYQKDNIILFLFSYHTIGMFFIVITTLISWFIYIKGDDRKYISAVGLLQIAGVFTFSVGMHERYLFPGVALAILAFAYLRDRRFFILAIGFSITSYINISTIFFSTSTVNFNNLLRGTSILNIILVIYLVKVTLNNVLKKSASKLKIEESRLLQ